MVEVTVTKGLIGEEDLSVGNGTFNRATSTGGTQAITKIGLKTFAGMLNVKDYGAVGDGTTDDTAAIQAAINDAAAIPADGNWAGDTSLHAVYFPCVAQGYLLVGQIIIPEGVALVGENFNGSRIWYNSSGWTPTVPKIRDYFFDGTTNSQQMIIKNLTFMPDPADFDNIAALSDCSVLHFKKVTECHIQDCRFLLHGWWGVIAPYSYTYVTNEADGLTAMKFQECVAVLLHNVGVDRGSTAVHGLKDSGGSNSIGIAWSRISDCYFYSQADYSIRLGPSCKYNTISGTVIDLPSTRNIGRGIFIELDGSADTLHNTISGNVIRVINEPIVCEAHENTIVGNAIVNTQSNPGVTVSGNLNCISGNRIQVGASAISISVGGRTNQIVANAFHSEASSNITETGTAHDNIIVSQDRFQTAGRFLLRTKDVTVAAADTWYDVANLYVPSTYMSLTARCEANVLLNNVGMISLSQTFGITRGAGDLAAYEVTSLHTEVGAGSGFSVEMQWASVDADNMMLQIKRNAGTSTGMSVVIELTGISQKSREQVIRLTDQNL